MSPKASSKKAADVRKKLRSVEMLILDVDGVLTEGGIILGTGEQEFKRFDVQDGMGVTLARKGGLKVGIITGRESDAVAIRARELHVDVLYQGKKNKIEAYEKIKEAYDLSAKEICYVGDDVLDIPVMRDVGVPVAVANARPEVKRIALYTTKATGGRGAVREVVELILKAQKKWKNVLEDLNAVV